MLSRFRRPSAVLNREWSSYQKEKMEPQQAGNGEGNEPTDTSSFAHGKRLGTTRSFTAINFILKTSKKTTRKRRASKDIKSQKKCSPRL